MQIPYQASTSQASQPTPPPSSGGLFVPYDGLTVAVALAIAGGGLALIKWFANRTITQVEQKFEAIDKRIQQSESHHKELMEKIEGLERTLLGHELKIANNYVSREDYLRQQTVLESGMYAIHRRLDEFTTLFLRGRNE